MGNTESEGFGQYWKCLFGQTSFKSQKLSQNLMVFTLPLLSESAK